MLKDNRSLGDVSYDYTYPGGLDLKPGSELHESIRTRLVRMARSSADVMSRHHDRWRDIDKALAVYVDLDEEEQDTKSADARIPTSFVVPLSTAILATDLAYDTEVFLDSDPVFPFNPVGPEDRYGTILLEMLIQRDVITNKVKIPLHTSYRNGHAYGLGVADAVWREHWGKKTVWTEDTEYSPDQGGEVQTGKYKKSRPKTLLFEGNALQAWDPYYTLIDPSVPLHDFQGGEMIGRVLSDNYTRLLGEEADTDSGLFNVRYCNHVDGRSALFNREDQRSADGQSGYEEPVDRGNESRPLDRLCLYVNLIPAEWGLGSKDEPEIWEFGLVGDQVLIYAEPTDRDHNMYPCAVNAPDYDGFSSVPNSHLSTVFPLNRVADWLLSAMMKGQGTTLNGKLFIDPSIWNINDLKENRDGQGWMVRKRRSAWGRDVKGWDAPTVMDPTQNNMNTVVGLLELAKDLAGSADSSMGILKKTSGRTSAAEAQGARVSALSRLARPAKMTSWMFMQDVAFLFGMHSQQYRSKDQNMRIAGRWVDTLREEYNVQDPFVSFSPADLSVNFDVVPGDAAMPSTEFGDIWAQAFQISMQSPQLQQEFAQSADVIGIFQHLARISGAKNVQDFVKRGGKATVVPDQQAAQMAQAGNIAPAGGL